MLTKIIYPESFDFGMPTVAALGAMRDGGLDKQCLSKRAALFTDISRDITTKPGYDYLHIISVGAEDTYGANNNGDGFNRSDKAVSIPHPERPEYRATMLTGGLQEHHGSFEKCAAVYKEHKNKHHKGTPSGYIVKAAFNTDMDRGELIIGVDSKIWESELEKVANEQPIYFSMGSDMPFDICSYCGHVRTKPRETCSHVAHDLLKTASDGTLVFTYNPNPLFHDISGVRKPAEKIAFGLRKVAEQSGVVDSITLAEYHGLAPAAALFKTGTLSARQELLAKLAKLEKRLLMECDGLADSFTPAAGFRELAQPEIDKLSAFDPNALFGALKRQYILLPCETFLKLVMGQHASQAEELMPLIKSKLPTIYEDMLSSPDVLSCLQDGSYEPENSCGMIPNTEITKLIGSHSLAAEPTKMRIIRITVAGKPHGEVMPKQAGAFEPAKMATADLLAREYACYTLAFAAGLPEDKQYLTAAAMIGNSII